MKSLPKPDQEDTLKALATAKAACGALVQQLKGAGHEPRGAIPAGDDVQAAANVWGMLWQQASQAGVPGIRALPFVLNESDEDAIVVAIVAQTPAPAAAPAPKTAAAPAAKPAAFTFTAWDVKPPTTGQASEGPVECRSYTEMAMALKAGKKVALKAPPKKPTFTQRAIEKLAELRAK